MTAGLAFLTDSEAKEAKAQTPSSRLPIGRDPPRLLERESELDQLHDAVGTACAGSGTVVIVEGQSGLGKSALLDLVCGGAREEGLAVLTARGTEFESAYPWGVVRNLFSPVLAGPGTQRSTVFAGAAALADVPLGLHRFPPRLDAAEALGAALHGLYWALANLAAANPLVVAVDDAHWADAPSVRWLEYLAARIEDLPVLLLVALNPAEGGADKELILSLSTHAAAVLALAPLTQAATAELVVRRLGPGEPLAEACHAGTGGNPFLVQAVLDELSEQDGDTAVERLGRVESATLSRAVELRLGRLSPEARALAAAIAVCGGRTRLHQAAAVAGIEDRDTATGAADSLAAAGLIKPGEPLEFVQPVIGTIVHGSMPGRKRSAWHARAAELLERAGAPREAVAIHLLAVDPSGDTLLVDVLAEAARDALASGAPEAAETYLERALAEPPGASQHAGVLRLLGHVEGSLHRVAAVEHLRAALDRATDARERAQLARELAVPLVHSGHVHRAVAVLERSYTELGDADRELSLELQADLIHAGRLHPELREAALSHARTLRDARLRGRSGSERLALAAVAAEGDAVLATAEEATDCAQRALGDGRLLAEVGPESPSYWYAVSALVFADACDAAEAAIDSAVEDARKKGSKLGSALAYCFRALLEYRTGRLPEAESDARHAIEIVPSTRWAARAYSLAFLIDVLLDRGRPDEASGALAESGTPETGPPLLPYLALRQNRGRLRIATGEVAAGLADMEAVAEGFAAGSFGPCVWPWRSLHALELAREGNAERAMRLVREEVALARAFGAPRAVGFALRAAGVVEGGERGIASLRRAVRVLAESPAALEHARALVDLGVLLRREGQRSEALARLREGLDLGHRCAAVALTERARAEMVMAGARPRREAARGPDSLTAGELRVARMAADGMANREIAQALYVSLRTVETHLTHAYRKLDIGSRDELSKALAAGL